MQIVVLTALGVGGATVAGAVVGFLARGFARRFSGSVMAFSAGVMLAAAILGLILPSLENPGLLPLPTTLAGLLSGALAIRCLERLVPYLQKLAGLERPGADAQSALLFVAAIAIHNLPEGLAAGVSFGTKDTAQALLIAGGIALQNIPEGMVIIAPMLSAGIRPGRTFCIGLATGLIEVVGTMLGFFAVTASAAILPFALAFAGGTMLYVIVEEMIPESPAGMWLLAGFGVMLGCDYLLSR